MEQEKAVKSLKTIFTAIIKRLVDSSFKISEGGATARALTNFIGLVNKEFGSLNEERLVDICVFIAYAYRDKLLPIRSMFGQAMLKRYQSHKRGQRFYENAWLEEAGVTRAQLIAMIADRSAHPQAEFMYMPSEECRKKRLLNTRAGYIMCQVSTLGWSPLSEACRSCTFVQDCQKETERKYPELYRIRLEHGSRTAK